MTAVDVVVAEPNFTGYRRVCCRHVLTGLPTASRRGVVATSLDSLLSSGYEEGIASERLSPEVMDLGAVGDATTTAYWDRVADQVATLSSAHPDARVLVLEEDKALWPLIRGLRSDLARCVTILVMRAPTPLRIGLRRRSARSLTKRALMAVAARGMRVLVLAPATFASSVYRYAGSPLVPDLDGSPRRPKRRGAPGRQPLTPGALEPNRPRSCSVSSDVWGASPHTVPGIAVVRGRSSQAVKSRSWFGCTPPRGDGEKMGR